MPSHEGRFDHFHTMVAAGLVARLGSPLPRDDGVLELAAVRSTSGGTLSTMLQEFGEATAAYDVERLSGRLPSACFFKGGDNDVSKLSALKAVAEHIKLNDGVDERVAEDCVVDDVSSERRHSLVRLKVFDESRVG